MKRKPFKKGMLLLCTHARDIRKLTIGKPYRVAKDEEPGIFETRPYITVEGEDGWIECHASRFEPWEQPSENGFAPGQRVTTEQGPGVIMIRDVYEDGKTDPERWGVLHDKYPEDKPVGMYTDDILYYFPKELSHE